jgi:DNA modification methylase
MVEIMQSLRRVLKRTGSVFIVIGDSYHGGQRKRNEPQTISPQRTSFFKDMPLLANRNLPNDGGWLQPTQLLLVPSRLAIALQDDGWLLRNDLIWHKRNPMPYSGYDRFANTYEHVLFLQRPNEKKVYWVHKLTGEIVSTKPPKDDKIMRVIMGKEKMVPAWVGLSHYFDLASIREPHSTETKKRAMRGSSGKRRENSKDAFFGNPPHLAETRQHQGYEDMDERISKGLSKIHPLGKNLGDIISTHKRTASEYTPIKGGETKNDPNLAAHWHPLGKNPGDVISHKEWKDAFTTSAPTQYVTNIRLKHPLGKNPGDMIVQGKFGETNYGQKPQGFSRKRHSGYFDEDGNLLVHPLGKNPGDIFSLSTSGFKGKHFATYPPELCIRPILAACPLNGVVLDPMCGSGTTLLVAKALGRNFIGIDISREYCDMTEERLRHIPSPLSPITKIADARKALENIRGTA